MPEFATELFNEILKIKSTENILISPASIQSCVAMGYFGAEGKTAEEISTGLHLNTNNKQEVSSKFEKLSHSAKEVIKIANKLYANKMYEIKPEFIQVAEKAFHSKAETLDFSKSAESIKTINDWVEENTNNKIKNLLASGSIDGETKMILVNAIYFKGSWTKPFSTKATHQADFWTNESNKVTITMMANVNTYKYGDFDELGTKAVELAYKNSDLSMIIILPYERTGITDLLSKIQSVDFLALSNRMETHDVELVIPKFQIEFDIILNDVLKSMGMTTMFSDEANFSSLFITESPVKISAVVHKTFIDINESGTEAAAASAMKAMNKAINFDERKFRADHPFVYLIKDENYVYFVGLVVKF